MSSKPRRPSLRDIVSEDIRVVQSKQAEPELAPAPAPAPVESFAPARNGGGKGGTLKERAKQFSTYLEEPVYDALRDIAHTERTKIHALLLEGIDLVLKKRGMPSISKLMRDRKTG